MCFCLYSCPSLGGLFEAPDESQFHAFQYAVSRINADTHMLPWAQIETDVRYVSTDSFSTSKQGRFQ